MRRLVFRLYFLMLDGQRSIMSGHFFVMLSGNWVACLFGTFFKHASAFDKVLGDRHGTSLRSPILQSMRPRFCSCSEYAGGLAMSDRQGITTLWMTLLSVCRRAGLIANDRFCGHCADT